MERRQSGQLKSCSAARHPVRGAVDGEGREQAGQGVVTVETRVDPSAISSCLAVARRRRRIVSPVDAARMEEMVAREAGHRLVGLIIRLADLADLDLTLVLASFLSLAALSHQTHACLASAGDHELAWLDSHHDAATANINPLLPSASLPPPFSSWPDLRSPVWLLSVFRPFRSASRGIESFAKSQSVWGCTQAIEEANSQRPLQQIRDQAT
eukprot:760976-Hanusia_phi.AAC.2